MAKMASPDDLKEWLERQPRAIAVVMALRIALRVLPLAVDVRAVSRKRRLTSAVFRAIAISRAVRQHLDPEITFTDADAAYSAFANAAVAFDAAAANADAATFAAAFTAAAEAAFAVDAAAAFAAAFAATATAAENVASGSAADIWNVIDDDCRWLGEAKRDADRLAARALWPDAPPPWFKRTWQAFRVPARRTGSSWTQWVLWFERRIKGDASEWGLPPEQDAEMVHRLLTAGDAWWKEGEKKPSLVNAQIAQWIAELRSEKPVTIRHVDFFISYANENEGMARELLEVLESEGISTFVQFKDIGPGNFITEMNRGLAASNRFIALYSPAYVSSDHCQAEWAAAYNRDPAGANWHIVSFLLEPCELDHLARQVVYKRLIGLTKAQRRKAILDWVHRQPRQISPDEAAEIATKVVSPKPVVLASGKLAMAPNPVFDAVANPQDLLDHPRQLKLLIKATLVALGQNAPAIIRSNLRTVHNEIVEHGRNASWGAVDRMLCAAETSFRNADEKEFDEGEKHQLEEIFKLNALCQGAVDQADERDRELSEIRVKEEVTGEAISRPVDSIEDAVSDLSEAGLTEPSFDQNLEALIEMGREQEFAVPRDPNAVPKAISMRKAWIIGALGIVKETYNLLGSTASLGGIPVVVAAMEKLGEAVIWLMKLIH